MFCTTCGKDIPDGSAVCPACGVATSNGQTQKTEANPYQAPPVYPQNTYQQSYPAAQEPDKRREPMSVGQWLLTSLVMCIPIVNIVMMIVWAVSSTTNINRKNYCIAMIIVWAIMFVLTIVLSVTIGTALFSLVSQGAFDGFSGRYNW